MFKHITYGNGLNKSLYRKVFVQILPGNTNSISNQFPFLKFLLWGIFESWVKRNFCFQYFTRIQNNTNQIQFFINNYIFTYPEYRLNQLSGITRKIDRVCGYFYRLIIPTLRNEGLCIVFSPNKGDIHTINSNQFDFSEFKLRFSNYRMYNEEYTFRVSNITGFETAVINYIHWSMIND